MIPAHRAPTHPGEMLLEEFLKPLGMTQVEAAQRMGIPLNRLNEVIHRRRGVSADTAIRLAQLVGTSPAFWMNLQAMWDMYHAAKKLHLNLDALCAAGTESQTPVAVTGHGEALSAPWNPLLMTSLNVDVEVVTEIRNVAADSQYELAA